MCSWAAQEATEWYFANWPDELFLWICSPSFLQILHQLKPWGNPQGQIFAFGPWEQREEQKAETPNCPDSSRKLPTMQKITFMSRYTENLPRETVESRSIPENKFYETIGLIRKNHSTFWVTHTLKSYLQAGLQDWDWVKIRKGSGWFSLIHVCSFSSPWEKHRAKALGKHPNLIFLPLLTDWLFRGTG